MTPKKSEERPVGKIRNIPCARSCGYKRPYTDANWWLARVIDHPVYGMITGEALVQREMWDHNCDRFQVAQAKFRTISGYKGRQYNEGK